MSHRRRNTQLFALRDAPPQHITLGGGPYRLVRVFKHDFFAATCLYQADADALPPRVVVKLGRTQPFCGLPMDWYGRWLHNHERDVYAALAGVEGVPRWAGSISPTAFAIEFVEAVPLDHLPAPPPGFFDALAAIMRQIHARHVAYMDANKRSNILVSPQGRPFLVDFQLAFRWRRGLPWPLGAIHGAITRGVQRWDIYHIYKHKRRLAPQELTAEEDELSRRRGLLHFLHRKIGKAWRGGRRRFLRHQVRSGRLESPTAEMEDHNQPEKAAWRGR